MVSGMRRSLRIRQAQNAKKPATPLRAAGKVWSQEEKRQVPKHLPPHLTARQPGGVTARLLLPVWGARTGSLFSVTNSSLES